MIGLMDGLMVGWMNARLCVWMNDGWMIGWMDAWLNDAWLVDWMDGCMVG